MLNKIILFSLGNPGEQYKFTRHNAGFLFVDLLAERWRAEWSRPAISYLEARIKIAGRDTILIKPDTYVNLSGEALADLEQRVKFSHEELLAVCDDFNLPLGRIRLRRGGGDGGHHGLRSLIEHRGTTDFPRLRMGIGPLPQGLDPADFVLNTFLEGERPVLDTMFENALECVRSIITGGIEMAMAIFNAPSPSSDTD